MHSTPRFRLALVIDRLAVDFSVSRATQAWRVRNKLGRCVSYVDGLDATGIAFAPDKANTPTTTFRATFQDPPNAQTVQAVLQSCSPVTSPKLSMIEVALDAYVKDADAQQLSNILVDHYRFLEAQPASYWAIYRKKGEGSLSIQSKAVPDRRTLARKLADDWQLTDTADKDAARRFHGYVKTYDFDQASGRRVKLPVNQWRARLEVTLRGNEVPTDASGTLETLSLAKLADYFRFRKFADDLHPCARHVLLTSSVRQHGREGSYPRKHPTKFGIHSGQRTKYHTSTQADSNANEAVRMAQRLLNRGWNKNATTALSKSSNKNFRAALPSVPKVEQLALQPATPMGRVLWEFIWPGRNPRASNYRQELSPQLVLHSDGTTSIEMQMQEVEEA